MVLAAAVAKEAKVEGEVTGTTAVAALKASSVILTLFIPETGHVAMIVIIAIMVITARIVITAIIAIIQILAIIVSTCLNPVFLNGIGCKPRLTVGVSKDASGQLAHPPLRSVRSALEYFVDVRLVRNYIFLRSLGAMSVFPQIKGSILGLLS